MPNHNIRFSCILFHFYIKPQPQAALADVTKGCILFHFYIKPQPAIVALPLLSVVSYSISTSNHNISWLIILLGQVVSYSISTSNHNRCKRRTKPMKVVSYSISTSNHNRATARIIPPMVVSYSISTSNHNITLSMSPISELYLIPFLHQTTTLALRMIQRSGCILFHFYIKPQLGGFFISASSCCILFHFYIKPQLCWMCQFTCFCCILFHFYIKPQPTPLLDYEAIGCILFHFYIKPQLITCRGVCLAVVSYSISTSNHNFGTSHDTAKRLYLIPFLHQTTTLRNSYVKNQKLYLIPFLHQTTTW